MASSRVKLQPVFDLLCKELQEDCFRIFIPSARYLPAGFMSLYKMSGPAPAKLKGQPHLSE